ncbi:hypothetical protein [Streptococcus parauberis]|uniref:hypothetical protein n=1 Tax=Streptococcus parauberis TaxID=1348 RepID=UPI000C152F63|nr:hypothetical protein [Streptococcus parauberis]PIA83679.1 hypothetical protein ADO07_01547 [Streptococcus parauberis]
MIEFYLKHGEVKRIYNDQCIEVDNFEIAKRLAEKDTFILESNNNTIIIPGDNISHIVVKRDEEMK